MLSILDGPSMKVIWSYSREAHQDNKESSASFGQFDHMMFRHLVVPSTCYVWPHVIRLAHAFGRCHISEGCIYLWWLSTRGRDRRHMQQWLPVSWNNVNNACWSFQLPSGVLGGDTAVPSGASKGSVAWLDKETWDHFPFSTPRKSETCRAIFCSWWSKPLLAIDTSTWPL